MFNTLYKDHFVIISLLLTLILASIDFNLRLNSQHDTDTQTQRLQAPEPATFAVLSVKQLSLLNEKMALFMVEEQQGNEQLEEQNTALIETESMSAELQAQQNGLVKHLYIGDYRYSLLAVFMRDVPFAVFIKTDTRDGTAETIKLSLTHTIEEYNLKSIAADSVMFTAEQREITIKLFQSS